MIINLPKDLEKETTHRYGPNSFKLHRCAHRPDQPAARPAQRSAPPPAYSSRPTAAPQQQRAQR
jgi:hypothetical protein